MNGLKGGPQRPALGEVTTTAVNRKVSGRWFTLPKSLSRDPPSTSIVPQDAIKAAAKENLKDAVEQGVKRSRSSSLAAATGPQRVPAGPGRTETAANTSRISIARAQKPSVFKRMSRQETAVPVIVPTQVVEEKEIEMDVEGAEHLKTESGLVDMLEEKDEQGMVGVQETGVNSENITESEAVESKSPRMWPDVDTEKAMRHYNEVADVQRTYQDDVDIFDTTMVSEYSDEIFKYMSELEVGSLRFTQSAFVDWFFDRRTCCPTPIIWTGRMKLLGPCDKPSLIGFFKYTCGGICFLRRFGSPSTSLTVSLLGESCLSSSFNSSVLLRCSSPPSTKKFWHRPWTSLSS